MSPLRIGLVGYGRMGRSVADVAMERGHRVAWWTSREAGVGELSDDQLRGADVLVDFSAGALVPKTVRAAIGSGTPMVLGTTGWDDGGGIRACLREATDQSGVAVLEAPNLAIGMSRFRRIAARAVRDFSGDADVGVWIEERHHGEKADRPSGTALDLAEQIARLLPERLAEVEVASVRAGFVPGEHRVCIDTPEETIELVHRVRSRQVFAHGAVRAAEWVIGRQGWLTLDDFDRDGGAA